MKTLKIAVFLLAAAATLMAACSGGPSGQDTLGDAVDVMQDVRNDTVVPVDIIVLDNAVDRVEDTGIDVGTDTAGTDTAIQPGEFGAPCIQNTDCISGFCVEGVDGLVCTKTCLTECPDDWLCRGVLVEGDFVSLCVPGGVFLCRTCRANAQCADGLCIPVGGEGSFCGRSCSDLEPCPTNYECQEVQDQESANKSMQCVPLNGSCTCKKANDLQERVCEVINDFGTCIGYQTCHKETGWTGCTGLEPSAEICDGIDNDCNRVADDNPSFPEGDCFNTIENVGSCKGAWVCRGEDGWDCVGPMPAVENCNYLDDDCDGDTDEDFKGGSGALTDLHNCGQCGVDCDGLIPFAAETECSELHGSPECMVVKCVNGFVKIDEHTCRAAVSSVCVPCDADEDCGTSGIDKCLPIGGGSYCGRDCTAAGPYGPTCPNGYTCSDFGDGVMQCIPQSGTCECTMASDGVVRLCEVVNGYGTCQGAEVCDGSIGWVNCTARTPAAEICDGIDNDCDGIADDAPDAPVEPCEKVWTDPATSVEYSCSAEWQCAQTQGGKDWVCPARIPAAETCNNVDDNCDGQVDENFKLAGTNKYNDVANCGACNVSCAGMVPHATMMCDATGPQPQCIVDKCDDGWWKASDLSCVPFPQSLCMACSSDAACQIPGDACLPADAAGNSYCLWDCGEDALRPETSPELGTCPAGFHCRETNDLGQPFFKCMPDSGACDCLAADAGRTRACMVSNGFGRCYGTESCAPATGWTACDARTPASETCNTQDDDCNGLVDEIFPSLGATCAAGIGECQRAGSIVCNGAGTGVECNAVAVAGSVELCDSLDNDCDMLFDEDFPDLGKVCFAGAGECLASGVYECSIDGSGTVCNAVQGTGSAEICDQKDNDCDTFIDEDFPNKGRVCAVGVGECFANGVWVCTTDNNGLVCDGIEGAPVDEKCDGVDNDCDILVDELWPEKNTVCVVGVGACRNTGTYRCTTDKSGIECSVAAGLPSDEICDGIDNDCDGSIDETWTNKGRACQEGIGECLDNGVWVCTADHSGIECDAVAGMPMDEACDGLDNNCDGAIDESFTNLGHACSAGWGECLVAGVYQCTGDQTGTECNAQAGTGVTELCDGLDNDCDGAIDETWTNKGRACQEGVGACLDNGVWVCKGDRTGVECDATPGLPVDELCDGIDNNCDGFVDEPWTEKGRACQEGVGACLDNGVWVCKSDRSTVECSAEPGTPVAELCDGIDNDCDTLIDETWTNKGTACMEGVGACVDSGVWICRTDKAGVECDAEPGTPVTELCDGIDNDCDTLIDETWTNKGSACQEGTGACLDNGVWICRADKAGVECDAEPGTPVAELCDGIDNNCDGAVDEAWLNKGTACQEGVGACLDNGVWVCKGDKSGIECDAEPGTAVAEQCDGIDNDCDGSADETWTDKGRACQEGVGACLDNGVWVCKGDKSGIECDAEPGTAVAEQCDGLDNDCDGDIDENWSDKGKACQMGLGECLASGVYVCTTDKLDIECNAVQGLPLPEECDGMDNDCDGAIDETWPEKGTACQSGVGECQANGVWVCTGDFSDVECNAVEGAPAAELCDGLDNDCDTQYDEEFPLKGSVCFDGVGACQRSGTMNCTIDGLGLDCGAEPGAPVAERCDGIDNDCDSATDETFPDKGKVCTVGVGQCVVTGTWECNVAQNGVVCPAEEGDPVAETCDYLDNDCDGQTDQTFKSGGKYYTDAACGNCFTDCTEIYDLPNAAGQCDSSGVPACRMVCDTNYYDLNQIPDDGCEFFLDSTAVYVSSDDTMAADTASCGLAPSVLGTGQYPCLTIQYGIDRSVALNRRNVLVSNGLYGGSVSVTGATVPGGVNLKGGYRADTWERDVATTLTTIRGATGAGHVAAVTFDSVTAASMLEGFIVQGAIATGVGANSYGVYVKDCTSVVQILSNIVYGGAGGPGAAGSNGDPGTAGAPGSQGVATRPINTGTGTCWGDPASGYLGNTGGAAGSRTCNNYGGGTTVVSGGKGGFTSCPAKGRQEGSTKPNETPGSGSAGSGTTPGGGGAGGYGFDSTGGTCYYAVGTTPSPGNGADATTGTNGLGGSGAGTAAGSVSSNHWAGTAGSTGTNGNHGSGGGGGGGGAGNNIGSTSTDDFGGGGGGGGSGGCGGFPGTGGNAGGGSFSVFVTFTGVGPTNLSQMPVINGNVLSRGQGGRGGAGGNGGTGGQGGAGGLGGPIGTYNGPLACIFAGGKGGNGGAGGHAGGGGGGAGGVSWDIYVYNTNSISTGYDSANTFLVSAGTATSGAGGNGGLSSNTTNGAGGLGVTGEYGNLKAVP